MAKIKYSELPSEQKEIANKPEYQLWNLRVELFSIFTMMFGSFLLSLALSFLFYTIYQDIATSLCAGIIGLVISYIVVDGISEHYKNKAHKERWGF